METLITYIPPLELGQDIENVEYVRPEVEDLDLEENLTPEMPQAARSGMGMCKHTYS